MFAIDKRVAQMVWYPAPDVIPQLGYALEEIPADLWNEHSDLYELADAVRLVRQGALARYRFLEHGAFWAIAALGAIMLASTLVAIPETVTGLIGAVLIAAAVWSSWRATRRERAAGTIA